MSSRRSLSSLLSSSSAILPSEITPETVWRKRRQLIAGLAAGTGLAGLPAALRAQADAAAPAADVFDGLTPRRDPAYMLMDAQTRERDVTTYNNFYEFGTDKRDPSRHAGKLQLRPWMVAIEGEVEKPGVYDIDDLLRLAPMEERIYRLRCVEGWSMVIPWLGYSLAELLKRVAPTSKAKYVEFETVVQPENMPGLSSRVLDWPYVEVLRIDEAMHPLTMLVFGLYGKALPGQNGAPLRLAVPWKYGFKSAKSIAAIRLVEKQPASSWIRAAPHEYGFYANVNPDVSHPRWSQATERRIGEPGGILAPRRKTLMFNGYAEQVASLYQGMDLRANY